MSQSALTTARQLLAIRRMQRTVFRSSIFDQPMFDVLLILYVSAAEGVAVDRAAIGARCGASPTLLARLVNVLTTREIVSEGPDGVLELTAMGRAQLVQTLAASK